MNDDIIEEVQVLEMIKATTNQMGE